jgi:hypothetical protein
MTQAKDIPDDLMLMAILSCSKEYVSSSRIRKLPAMLWEIQDALPYPGKVVLAKLKSMIKRKMIDGCACGCRGDFTIVEKEGV